MLLLNVLLRLWWQPKEGDTFPLPHSSPRYASAAILGILSLSCKPAFASHWQRDGRLHWDSCSHCPSAVFVAVPGINLFSKLAPSPGKWLCAGDCLERGGLLVPPPCWAEGSSHQLISWQAAHLVLVPYPGFPHSTVPEPALCRQQWKEDFFFFLGN